MHPVASRPLTFYLTGLLGVFVIISGLIGLAGQVFSFARTTVGQDAAGQLGGAVLFPIVLGYIVQVGSMLLGIGILIKKTLQWNTSAIILSAAIAPVLLLAVVSAVWGVFADDPAGPLPGAPVVPIVVCLMYWLVAGVIAYIDVRYRKPRAVAAVPITLTTENGQAIPYAGYPYSSLTNENEVQK